MTRNRLESTAARWASSNSRNVWPSIDKFSYVTSIVFWQHSLWCCPISLKHRSHGSFVAVRFSFESVAMAPQHALPPPAKCPLRLVCATSSSSIVDRSSSLIVASSRLPSCLYLFIWYNTSKIKQHNGNIYTIII